MRFTVFIFLDIVDTSRSSFERNGVFEVCYWIVPELFGCSVPVVFSSSVDKFSSLRAFTSCCTYILSLINLSKEL
jgi:hypothetical protein